MKRAELWGGTSALSVEPERRTDNTQKRAARARFLMKGLLIERYYDGWKGYLESYYVFELNPSFVLFCFCGICSKVPCCSGETYRLIFTFKEL